MSKTRIVVTALLGGLLALPTAYAAPQQITSAVFRASAQYCGTVASIAVEAAQVPAGGCADSSIDCSTTQLEMSTCLSASGLSIGVSAATSASLGIPFTVTAGPRGATLRCEAAGIEAYSSKGAPFDGGEMEVPAGATVAFVVGWPFGATTEGTVTLTVLAGGLSSAAIEEGGSIDSSDSDGLSWTCTAENAWSFAMSDLACPSVPCSGEDPDCGGQFGAGSATAAVVEAEVYGGAPRASLDLLCDFTLSAPALVRYEVDGGGYCDPSFLDGEEIAFDPGEGCNGDSGYLCLEAGTHTMRVYNYDLGDSSLRLSIVPGACVDCDNDGQADRNQIDWDVRFGAGDLDTNGNLQLDSCERAGGDLDLDGVVGSTDLGILLAAWGGSGADLNGDGRTDAIDLGILLATWD